MLGFIGNLLPHQLMEQFTGRSLVTFVPDATATQLRQFIRLISDAIRRNFFLPVDLVETTRYFDTIRAAVIPVDAELLRTVMSLTDLRFTTAIDYERKVKVVRTALESNGMISTAALGAMGVLSSSATGRGVTVAILDSGVDVGHPDFAGRITPMMPSSGIDVFGHGTHCAGLACGPVHPSNGLRYGVAPAAKILSVRVLDEFGFFVDGDIAGGMEWAIKNGASVISLSLGGGVAVGSRHSTSLEDVARRITDRGAMIIASAGNDSSGSGNHPVNHPANCPSIMAVAALGSTLQPSRNSCVQVNTDGEINFAAPGIGLRSAAPRPLGYGVKSGTSQANALAAGIAALWAERGHRGRNLMDALRRSALPLAGSSPTKVGAGLLRAPA